jgi:hypothetical protein
VERVKVKHIIGSRFGRADDIIRRLVVGSIRNISFGNV